MDPVATWTALSTLGAALFTAGGYFFARSGQQQPLASGAAASQGAEELMQMRAAFAEAQSEAQLGAERIRSLSAELEAERRNAPSMQAALTDAQRRATRAEADAKRVAEAEERMRAAEAAGNDAAQRLLAAEKQATQHRAKAQELERKVETLHAQLEDTHSQKTIVRQPGPVALPPPAAPPSRELESLKTQHQAATARAAKAEQERDALRKRQAEAEKQAAGQAAHTQELERLVAKLQGELEALQAEQNTLVLPPAAPAFAAPAAEDAKRFEAERRDLLARATRAEEERDALRRRYADLEADRARAMEGTEEARSQARHSEDELATLGKKLGQAQGEAAEARSDARRAEEQLAAANQELADLRRAVAHGFQERAVERDQLASARDRAEELATEVARLRQMESEVLTLKRDHAALLEQHRQLEAHQFAASPKASIPPSQRSEAAGTDVSNDTMQSLVDRVMALEPMRSVAITDALGFAVVGGGEHVEALAAFGAFIVDVGGRAAGLLPVDATSRVTVRDKNGVTCTARALPGGELALVTLGVGEEPSRDVEQIINETPSLTN